MLESTPAWRSVAVGAGHTEYVDVGFGRECSFQLGIALGRPRDADDVDFDVGIGLLEISIAFAVVTDVASVPPSV